MLGPCKLSVLSPLQSGAGEILREHELGLLLTPRSRKGGGRAVHCSLASLEESRDHSFCQRKGGKWELAAATQCHAPSQGFMGKTVWCPGPLTLRREE